MIMRLSASCLHTALLFLFLTSAHAVNIEVRGQHQRADGFTHKFDVLDGDALHPGNRFQVILSADTQTYYSIVYVSRNGEVAQIFPPGEQPGKIAAGLKQYIPGNHNYFELDNNSGRELMYIITHDRNPENLPVILRQAQQFGNAPAELQRFLEEHFKHVHKMEITNTGKDIGGLRDNVTKGLVQDIVQSYSVNPWSELQTRQEEQDALRRSADNSIPEEVRRRAREVRSLLHSPSQTTQSSSLRLVAAPPSKDNDQQASDKTEATPGDTQTDTDIALGLNTETKQSTIPDTDTVTNAQLLAAEREELERQERLLAARLANEQAEAEARKLREEAAQRLREQRLAEAQAAEQAAAEARRLEAQRIAALEAEKEARRLAEAREAAQAARLEAERQQREAQRIAELEAARAKAEYAAAEEARRKQAERIAAETRRLEAQRIAALEAEKEARRLAEARETAQAARLEAQRQQREAQRIAELETARAAAEQARRKQAEHIAAEARRLEAQRIAALEAEKETRRLAEAREAAQAARLEAQRQQREAQRIAELETARAAAEQARRKHAERIAAEARRLEEQRIAALEAEKEARHLAEVREAAQAARLAAERRQREAQRTAELKVTEEARRLEEQRLAAIAAKAEAIRLEREREELEKKLRAEQIQTEAADTQNIAISAKPPADQPATQPQPEDTQEAISSGAEATALSATTRPREAVVVLRPENEPAARPLTVPVPQKETIISNEPLRTLYARVASAIVSIRTDNDEQAAGFILNKQGNILTSWHVIADVNDIDVEFMAISGTPRGYKARVIKHDKFRDLALLELINPPVGIRPIQMAALTLPEVGTKVRVFGQKGGQVWTTEDATITRVAENFTWFSANNVIHRGEILQIDLPADGKNIGSLVTNMDYRMLGIKSFSGRQTGKTYAVSTRTINDFLNTE